MWLHVELGDPLFAKCIPQEIEHKVTDITTMSALGFWVDLPAGCSIQLDRSSQAAVLDNIKQALGIGFKGLVSDLKAVGDIPLRRFRQRGRRGPRGRLCRIRTLFHWESQSGCHAEIKTGRRHITCVRGADHHALLFVRERRRDARGETMPYVLMGPVYYRSHKGDRPMEIKWELELPMPARMFQELKVAAG